MPSKPTALLIVDVQYDFLPGGALAVADADAILPVIHRLLDQHDRFDAIVASIVRPSDPRPSSPLPTQANHPGCTPYP